MIRGFLCNQQISGPRLYLLCTGYWLQSDWKELELRVNFAEPFKQISACEYIYNIQWFLRLHFSSCILPLLLSTTSNPIARTDVNNWYFCQAQRLKQHWNMDFLLLLLLLLPILITNNLLLMANFDKIRFLVQFSILCRNSAVLMFGSGLALTFCWD